MAFAAPSLSALYASLGDPVTLEGEATPRRAIFAEAGGTLLDGELIATEPSLRFPCALWPELARHTVLSVSGRRWRTRTAPRRLSDGQEAIVGLELAP
ncbi:MAG: hypothetical protein REI09_05240 [Candidatus Dactylopiibacterium sp.]|nr:hypothetical protein [Candidatus Dactylopiibacterium sp.]